MNIFLSPSAPENLVSRDGFGSPVPRQPAHLHIQAGSGAYLRDSSRVPRRQPSLCKPPYAIGSVPSLSGRHAIAYQWRSLPRVRRHRASKPQGSSKRVLPWQVTMDQLICASFSHTQYWYEVGMLKVPASSITTSMGPKPAMDYVRRAVWGMLYADDACLVSQSPQGLAKMMEVIVEVCRAFALTVSVKKTETMCMPPTRTMVRVEADRQIKSTNRYNSSLT